MEYDINLMSLVKEGIPIDDEQMVYFIGLGKVVSLEMGESIYLLGRCNEVGGSIYFDGYCGVR